MERTGPMSLSVRNGTDWKFQAETRKERSPSV